MCKAKDCYMYKTCLARWDLVGEPHCADYVKVAKKVPKKKETKK